MSPIKTHIFSFDRPAQLNMLLDSIVTFDTYKQLKVYVQYSYSNEEFKLGYEKLKLKFEMVVFIEEERTNKKITNPFIGNFIFNVALWCRNWRFRYKSSNFRSILLDSLRDSSSDYFMFLTDDSVFYGEILISEVILSELGKNKLSAYSLATGENINGSIYKRKNNIIYWGTSEKSSNPFWTYPFSVDGRIYYRKDLQSISKNLIFSNPNSYETIMVLYHRFFNNFKLIFSNRISSLIGFELNRVQTTYLNNNLQIDHYLINQFYLKDFKLSINFDSTQIDKFRPDIIDIHMIDSQNLEKISFNV
jgi:hypothetical protein